MNEPFLTQTVTLEGIDFQGTPTTMQFRPVREDEERPHTLEAFGSKWVAILPTPKPLPAS